MYQFIVENFNKSTTHAPPRPDEIKHTRLHFWRSTATKFL